MFEAWETFYLLIGTSAAALVGVMFIVTTLTAEIATDQVDRGITVYQNPIVFHLGAIVTASALAVMPDGLIGVIAVLLIALAIAGIVYSVLTLRRTLERYEFYQSTLADRALYGVAPALAYAVIGAGGIAIFLAPGWAAEIIGAASLALLLVSIRNAWDVATFAVRVARHQRARNEPPK